MRWTIKSTWEQFCVNMALAKGAETYWAHRGPRSPYSSGSIRQSSSGRSTIAYRISVGPMTTATTKQLMRSSCRWLADNFTTKTSACISPSVISILINSKTVNRRKRGGGSTPWMPQSFSGGESNWSASEPKESWGVLKYSDSNVRRLHHALIKQTKQTKKQQ